MIVKAIKTYIWPDGSRIIKDQWYRVTDVQKVADITLYKVFDPIQFKEFTGKIYASRFKVVNKGE